MKKIIALATSASALLLPLFASAQPEVIPNTLDEGLFSVRDLIVQITNWMFVFLLVLAVLFIIMAAYKYMFSQGSDEAVAAAHKMLIYAVVAIAVAFLAKGIVFVVRELVGGGNGGNNYSNNNNGSGGTNINIQTKYGSGGISF